MPFLHLDICAITANAQMYLLSDLSAVRPNSFPRDSITFIIMRHQYTSICSQILSTAPTDFRSTPWISTSPRYHPTHIGSLNRFSKNRKCDFWVLSRETMLPFDGTSSARVSFPVNWRRQAKSGCTFQRTLLHGKHTGAQKGKANYENRQGELWKPVKDSDTIGTTNLEKKKETRRFIKFMIWYTIFFKIILKIYK